MTTMLMIRFTCTKCKRDMRIPVAVTPEIPATRLDPREPEEIEYMEASCRHCAELFTKQDYAVIDDVIQYALRERRRMSA